MRNLFRNISVEYFLVFIFFSIISLFFSVTYPDFIIQVNIIVVLCLFGNFAAMKISLKKIYSSKNDHLSSENTLIIADKTLPHLKQGLNEHTAKNIVEIIKNISEVPAVAITDTEKVLAFIGIGCDKHPVGNPIVTDATKNCLETGEIQIVKNKEQFGCKIKGCECSLESAVIVPLFYKKKVEGTLKLYHTNKGKISKDTIKLATGISKLLSMQIELSELDHQTQLATEARLDALQAQVNPHFLFNTLNTINMYIHTNPEFARTLIVRLSTFLRYMMGNQSHFITIEEELKNVENYVIIEKARFGDKLTIMIDVDEKLKKIMIPVLSIQPLVNNAIIHGILPKNDQCLLKITVHKVYDEIIVTVTDNGVGIKKEDIKNIFEKGVGSGLGVGIPNVNERLKILYGDEYGLKIKSILGKGTKVWFKIPIEIKIK